MLALSASAIACTASLAAAKRSSSTLTWRQGHFFAEYALVCETQDIVNVIVTLWL